MPDSQGVSDLRHYGRVLRRRKWYIVGAILVMVGAAIGVSLLQTKVYESTAVLLLAPTNGQAVFSDNGGQAAQSPTADTETQIIQGARVADEVKRRIGIAPGITVQPVGTTPVVHLSAQSTQPKVAAQVANTYAQAYIDVRRTQALDDLSQFGQQVQAKIVDLQKQIDALPSDPGATADPTLTARKEALINQQSVFRQRLDQIQLAAGVNGGGAQIVTPAAASTTPIHPTPRRNALVAALAGLVLGIGLAFLLEQLDDSVKSKVDLERTAHGVPTIGIIPAVETPKGAEARIISVDAPKSSAAEAYRSLRTAIQFMGLERPIKVLHITSPSAAEGKTTTVANLAVALANAGQRVAIVDCDLRRPRIHRFFNQRSEPGFTSVLLGDVPLGDAVVRVAPRLVLLGSGPLPPNPSELLSGSRAAQVLNALRNDADIVLVDSPPVLPVTDSAVLSNHADATLLVTRAGVTTRRQLGRAVEVLQQVAAPLAGTVFNGVSAEEGYGYTYAYPYYYGHEEEEQERRPSASQI